MTIHFISGLPRSGSTLLANILAQNPSFRTEGTSGLVDLLVTVRNTWDQIRELQANPDRREDCERRRRVLSGIFWSFHAGRPRAPVAFDKSRSWLAFLELAEMCLQKKAKVLVPVRDVREILVSYETLWRCSRATRQLPQEAKFFHDFQTLEGRCAVWLRADQPVGIAWARLKDAFAQGFGDRLHLVRFEDLTTAPRRTLEGIYEFLGMDSFLHRFDHVEQVTQENDEVYGYKDLHTIRTSVNPVPLRWPEVLGDLAARFETLNFWNKEPNHGT